MGLIQDAKNKVHDTYKSTKEYLTGPKTTSTFQQDGKLTPEEFILAGDYLVHTCPTWSWEAGDSKNAKYFLPKDKQYLVTRGVPCLQRAAAIEQYGHVDESIVEADGDGEEGWLATGAPPGEPKTNADGFEEIPSATEELSSSVAASKTTEAGDDDDMIPDIADLELEDAAADENNAVSATAIDDTEEESGILKTRTYDLMITYDQHYAVARVWLKGFDEDGSPLTEQQVREDICREYYAKTVQADKPFPHSTAKIPVVCIHPCQHDNVIHKLAQVVVDTSQGQEFNVEHYMILFLKFISSVVPTIEYDYTMAVGGGS